MSPPRFDKCMMYTGWLGALALPGIYFGVCGPSLWEAGGAKSIILVIIAGILWLLTIYCYAGACFKDPGIIPREDMQNQIESVMPGFKKLVEDTIRMEAELSSNYNESLALQPESYHREFCDTCNIFRPTLSSHCRLCNHCCSVFDHHCNWIGNCVGQRNHREFIGFITLGTVLAWLLPVGIVVFLVDQDMRALSGPGLGLSALVALMIFISCFTCIMANMHLNFVSIGQTHKMRYKQGSITSRATEGCGTRCARLLRFFTHYTPRTSLVPRRVIMQAPVLLSRGPGPAFLPINADTPPAATVHSIAVSPLPDPATRTEVAALPSTAALPPDMWSDGQPSHVTLAVDPVATGQVHEKLAFRFDRRTFEV
jgi:hypothetical protein